MNSYKVYFLFIVKASSHVTCHKKVIGRTASRLRCKRIRQQGSVQTDGVIFIRKRIPKLYLFQKKQKKPLIYFYFDITQGQIDRIVQQCIIIVFDWIGNILIATERLIKLILEQF